MKASVVIGVDGCKSGWIAAVMDRRRAVKLEHFDQVDTLWEQYRTSCALLLIDMPIGLVDQGPDGRECDQQARKLLSPYRHSSIFTPPCRAAVYASQAEASSLNYSYTGKKLSLQTLNILPKIQETDRWQRRLRQEDRCKIKESHPEVVFAALHGGHALQYHKKRAAGKAERISLIKEYLPQLDQVLITARQKINSKMAEADDLLDAIVLALAGDLALRRPEIARSMPAFPPEDGEGLPMQIFYVAE